ncbi:MAG: T9SS type A sorting domain-containing protein [bacterium]
MKTRSVKSAAFFCAVIAAYPLVFYALRAGAVMVSRSYRIAMSQQITAGSGEPVTGGAYSMLGAVGQNSGTILSSARFSVDTGLLNSFPSPQLNLDTAHAYPNPFSRKKGHVSIVFSRLTLKATIQIYTVSGELVRTIYKDSNQDSLGWDVKGENGQTLAGGLYLYVVESSGVPRKTGKLAIIQ